MIEISQLGNTVRINLNNRGFDDVSNINDPNAYSHSPSNALGIPMIMPVRLKLSSDKDFWLLPVEPLVTVGGGNVIAKRNVAKGKGRGTIKERWSQDDYSVTIEGMLIYYDDENTFPEEDLQKLRSLCEAKEIIDVECDLLKYFDISRICIEKFDFPFTKGEDIQHYTITGYSDDITDLLVEDPNV
jgi:hypothetical protein